MIAVASCSASYSLPVDENSTAIDWGDLVRCRDGMSQRDAIELHLTRAPGLTSAIVLQAERCAWVPRSDARARRLLLHAHPFALHYPTSNVAVLTPQTSGVSTCASRSRSLTETTVINACCARPRGTRREETARDERQHPATVVSFVGHGRDRLVR